jgi:phage-related protein
MEPRHDAAPNPTTCIKYKNMDTPITLKRLFWMGSALEDLRAFPPDARAEVGIDLGLVQHGVDPRDWKPMPVVGRGVREIRVRCAGCAWRVFYVVENATSVYVLHAFRKTSQQTSSADILRGRARYRSIQ